MKAKILVTAIILTSLLSSCATDCRNKKWRTQRFVEHKAPASTTSETSTAS